MAHDDSRVLSKLGSKKDVLLKQEMIMAGLDGFTTDDAKKFCACSGMDSCKLASMEAMSNGKSNSDIR